MFNLKNVKIKKLSRVLLLSLTLVGILIVTANVVIYKQTQVVNNNWDTFNNNSVKKGKLLSGLRDAVGYGGMIHQFKNYVLRQDEKRIAKIYSKVKTAYKNIELYRSIGVTAQENIALDAIKSTIKKYNDAVKIAQKMALEGSDPRAVDKIIKISDGPALKAIKVLDAELDLSTLNNGKVLSNAVEAVSSYAIISSVISGLFLIAFIISGVFKRVVNALNQSVKAVDSISSGNLGLSFLLIQKMRWGNCCKGLKIWI